MRRHISLSFPLWVGIIFVIIVLVLASWTFAKNGTLAERAAAGLAVDCAVQAKSFREIEAGLKFLGRYPDGGFGFTRAELLRSIEEDRATYDLIDSRIDCPAPTP